MVIIWRDDEGIEQGKEAKVGLDELITAADILLIDLRVVGAERRAKHKPVEEREGERQVCFVF